MPLTASSCIIINMTDVPDESPRRYRPSRRVSPTGEENNSRVLTEEFLGMAVAYSNTLLFIGYEVNGLVEITVYPRYRFSSDDRVQGHLGYVRVPTGTPWEAILAAVDAVYDTAHNNYRIAATLRAAEVRTQGTRYEAAYEAIAELFRESWHGFALRLQRDHTVEKEGVKFEGVPPGPVLATWRGEKYTVRVFPTGSILVLKGDRRKSLQEVA